MRLFLFDIDGTLIQAGGAGRKALDAALIDVLGSLGAAESVRFDGKTDRAIIREILWATSPDSDVKTQNGFATRLERILERYLDHLPAAVSASEKYCVLPGVGEVLNALREMPNVRLGLATGNVRRGATIKLARAQLDRFFETGGFGCDAEVRTELVRTGIERARKHFAYNFLPENIFVIGDTEHDIEAGRACGAKTIGVATGSYTKDDLASYGPDFLFTDFSDWRNFLSFFP